MQSTGLQAGDPQHALLLPLGEHLGWPLSQRPVHRPRRDGCARPGSSGRIPDPDAAASKWLERVGLERVATGLVREFSRGMRQRLAVARAFLHDPRVLLLDEPFTALDDKAIAVLQAVLREAIAEGKTVMMSTHQLREALELATHVALVVRGKIAYHGERTHEMLADPTYLYRTYGEA